MEKMHVIDICVKFKYIFTNFAPIFFALVYYGISYVFECFKLNFKG